MIAAERRFDTGGTLLRDLGEEALLDALVAAATAVRAGPSVVVGPGDDGAVWRPAPGRDLVVTQDALVEGEDFKREWSTPYQVGARLLAVSLSDLAGMAALPAFCTATLCAAETTQVDDVLAIQAGLVAMGEAHGCPLLGGDVSRTNGPLVLDLMAMGTVPPERSLRRDRGRPGDVLLVTGTLGRAAAGLALLRSGVPEPAGSAGEEWVSAQRSPVPRVAEGLALAGAGVRCGGDVSDGLIVDAARTARASGCGAVLWAGSLPVDPGIRERFRQQWLELAIGGGEDFELLCAVPADAVDDLVASWPPGLAPLTPVGALTAESGMRLLDGHNGNVMQFPPVHSRHFS